MCRRDFAEPRIEMIRRPGRGRVFGEIAATLSPSCARSSGDIAVRRSTAVASARESPPGRKGPPRLGHDPRSLSVEHGDERTAAGQIRLQFTGHRHRKDRIRRRLSKQGVGAGEECRHLVKANCPRNETVRSIASHDSSFAHAAIRPSPAMTHMMSRRAQASSPRQNRRKVLGSADVSGKQHRNPDDRSEADAAGKASKTASPQFGKYRIASAGTRDARWRE